MEALLTARGSRNLHPVQRKKKIKEAVKEAERLTWEGFGEFMKESVKTNQNLFCKIITKKRFPDS